MLSATRYGTALCAIALALAAPVAHGQWARNPDMPAGSAVPHLVENFNAEDWNASNYAPPEDVARFQDLRFGLMVSFGLTVHDKAELSWGTIDRAHRRKPDGDALADGVHVPTEPWVNWSHELTLKNFNADQWVAQARQSGFKYIIFLSKHHEGFHFWDTALSDFKVTNSPYGRDMLGELIAACHRAHMPVGIYFSQRDWYRPSYQPTGFGKDGQSQGPAHHEYIDYQFKAVHELLTKYGKIDFWWWDALWWGGMFNESMWDSEHLTREIRRLQPHILINNRASLPGDFDTPEQRLGGFQNWRPYEAAVSLEDTWSFSGGRHKSPDDVIAMLINTATNNGNLLLSIGPRWQGDFDPAEMADMKIVGDWLADSGSSIYATRGGPWKTHPWGGSTWRGSTAFVHATTITGEHIAMQMPPGKTVHAVHLLHGGALDYSMAKGELTIVVPAGVQDKRDTIIAVDFTSELSGVAPIGYAGGDHAAGGKNALTPFDYELVYGPRLTSGVTVTASSLAAPGAQDDLANVVIGPSDAIEALTTTSERHATITAALDKARFVTGIALAANAGGAPLSLEGSVDGKAWRPIWQAPIAAEAAQWDIEVNDFNAGAETPGRLMRFVRLVVTATKPAALTLRQLHIWAKDAK